MQEHSVQLAGKEISIVLAVFSLIISHKNLVSMGIRNLP